MIKIIDKEYLDKGEAKREYSIKILGIPFFKRINSTTNNDIVRVLKKKEVKQDKGFKN